MCLNSERRRYAVLHRVTEREEGVVARNVKQMSGSSAAPEMAEQRHRLIPVHVSRGKMRGDNILLGYLLAPTGCMILSLFTCLSLCECNLNIHAQVLADRFCKNTQPQCIWACTPACSLAGHLHLDTQKLEHVIYLSKQRRPAEVREGCLSVAHRATGPHTNHTEMISSERLMPFTVLHKKPNSCSVYLQT